MHTQVFFLRTDERAGAQGPEGPAAGRPPLRPRAQLPLVLAWLWRIRPVEIPLISDQYGRPALVGSPLRFAVDRMAGHLMVAISRERPVGICLHPPAAEVAEQSRLLLSPGEQRILDADDRAPVCAAGIVRLLTRKRAALRLLGWQPPSRIREVRTVTHHADHATMAVPGLGPVSVHDLPAGDGVLAAVATHPEAGNGIQAFTADYGPVRAWASERGTPALVESARRM